MCKKLVLLTTLLVTLLLSCAAVSAEQDGNTCWCYTDQYGCWIFNEDSSTMYLMFWSEYARQYIMGSHSQPYEMVVPFPGFYGAYNIPCGSAEPAAITTAASVAKPTAAPDAEPDANSTSDNNSTGNSNTGGSNFCDAICAAYTYPSDKVNCIISCQGMTSGGY